MSSTDSFTPFSANNSEDIRSALSNFLDKECRLTAFPVKRKMKLYSLLFFSQFFEAGRNYTENEVNSIICEHSTFDDPATIRRELCSYGYFSRTADGSCYTCENSTAAE